MPELSLIWEHTPARSLRGGDKQIDAIKSDGGVFATIYPAFTGTADKQDWGPKWEGVPYLIFWPTHPCRADEYDKDYSVWFVVFHDMKTPSAHEHSLLEARALIFHNFDIYCRARGYAAPQRITHDIHDDTTDLSCLDAHISEAAHEFPNSYLPALSVDMRALEAELEEMA